MFYVLTVLAVVVISTGLTLAVGSGGDRLLKVTSALLFITGGMILLALGRGYPLLKEEHRTKTLQWLYEPLSTIPNWVLWSGIVTIGLLLGISLVLIIDEDVNPWPLRKGGSR